jgi:ABC-2 type transport system ATP-binding protein
LLDERTLGIDVESAAKMGQFLVELIHVQGDGYYWQLSAEPDRGIRQRVIIFQRGRIVAQERVEELLTLFATRSYRFWTEQQLSEMTKSCLLSRFPAAELGVLMVLRPS